MALGGCPCMLPHALIHRKTPEKIASYGVTSYETNLKENMYKIAINYLTDFNL
jgi:hypothetical protein